MKNLKNSVLEIVQSRGSEKEQKEFMEQVLEHGCISGIVAELVYYSDTKAWYSEHMNEIDEMLLEALESHGYESGEEKMLFGDKWESLEDITEFHDIDVEYDDYDSDIDYEQAIEDYWSEFVEGIDVNIHNDNLLAWFSFEETVRDIYEEKYGDF